MLLKINHLSLGLLLSLTLSCSSQAQQPDSPLSPDELQEDYRLFRQALEEAHPALYSYTTKADFDIAFDSTAELLNRKMSEQEFYSLLSPLITRIRCGHTKLMAGGREDPKYPYHTNQLLPLKLMVTEEQVFVEHDFGQELIPTGAMLLEINGKPAEEIVRQLLPYVSFADGMAQASKYLELSNYFSGYYAAFVEAEQVYRLSFRKPDGEVASVQLGAISLADIKAYEANHAKPAEEPLQLEIRDEVAILSIRSFWFEDKEINFKHFLKESFAQVHQQEVKSLIIDLRNNEGGKDSYGALLYSYLTDQPFDYYRQIVTNTDQRFSFDEYVQLPWFFWIYRQLIRQNEAGEHIWTRHENLDKQQPQEEPFLGEVYVLINGRSFSVTSEFAAVAYSNHRATFIGQESGGGYRGNNSGFFAIVSLPHSQLVLGIPLWRYELAVAPSPLSSRGIVPHYSIRRDIQSLLLQQDLELQKAMELANQAASTHVDKH